MGKKKSSNPLEIHRKALRQRELKKNRERRHQAQETLLVQRDTRQLEQDIQSLESLRGEKGGDDVEAKLSQHKAELARIKAAKDVYLREHPEHRRLVYLHEATEKPDRNRQESQQARDQQMQQPDPRRSVYYHETFNPLGAPPPGMPYMEKTQQQWDAEQRAEVEASLGAKKTEASSDAEEESEDGEGEDDDGEDASEEDVSLPLGRPPLTQEDDGTESDSSQDSDGVIMPAGPPPARPPTAPRAMAKVAPASDAAGALPPLPPGLTPPWAYIHARRPPPPMHYQSLTPQYGSGPPPLPSQMQPQMPHFAEHARHVPRPLPFPQAPPSAASASVGPMQSSRWPPPRPGLASPRPVAVISAAPVLRDLKKEAMTFVPTALRKKQAAGRAQAAKGGLPNAVNAAPSADGDLVTTGDKMNLMDTLQPHLDQQRNVAEVSGRDARPADDDYKKFLGEIGDLL